MQIDLNQHNLKEQHAQIKKTWIALAVEIISEDDIQSGSVPNGPEGQRSGGATGFKFHS